jgi:hypothetical protein
MREQRISGLFVARPSGVHSRRRGPLEQGLHVVEAAKRRLDTRHEFTRTKRLGDVVIGTELQPEDAIEFFVLTR